MDDRGCSRNPGCRLWNYVAGPASATVMSDFGAEVIKIERPGGGDLWRIYSKLPGVASPSLTGAGYSPAVTRKCCAGPRRPEGASACSPRTHADVFVTNYRRRCSRNSSDLG